MDTTSISKSKCIHKHVHYFLVDCTVHTIFNMHDVYIITNKIILKTLGKKKPYAMKKILMNKEKYVTTLSHITHELKQSKLILSEKTYSNI